jgi:hypothetical protein
VPEALLLDRPNEPFGVGVRQGGQLRGMRTKRRASFA